MNIYIFVSTDCDYCCPTHKGGTGSTNSWYL